MSCDLPYPNPYSIHVQPIPNHVQPIPNHVQPNPKPCPTQSQTHIPTQYPTQSPLQTTLFQKKIECLLQYHTNSEHRILQRTNKRTCPATKPSPPPHTSRQCTRILPSCVKKKPSETWTSLLKLCRQSISPSCVRCTRRRWENRINTAMKDMTRWCGRPRWAWKSTAAVNLTNEYLNTRRIPRSTRALTPINPKSINSSTCWAPRRCVAHSSPFQRCCDRSKPTLRKCVKWNVKW